MQGGRSGPLITPKQFHDSMEKPSEAQNQSTAFPDIASILLAKSYNAAPLGPQSRFAFFRSFATCPFREKNQPTHELNDDCQLQSLSRRLVRNEDAGSPAWFVRLGMESLEKAKRTDLGSETAAAETTTSSPTMLALAA